MLSTALTGATPTSCMTSGAWQRNANAAPRTSRFHGMFGLCRTGSSSRARKGCCGQTSSPMWVTHTPQLPLPKAPARALQAMTEGLSICAQVPANVARFALKKIVQYDGLHSLVTAFYNALQTGTPMPVSVEQARSTVYWTSRVFQEADAAKIKFQSQFQTAGPVKIMVTGATGLIGRHLVRRLLQEGNRVRIFVRRQPPAEFMNDGNVEVLLGDLGDPAAVDRAVAGAEIVYHVGAAMKGGARRP